jgi:hypothetical protein
MMREKRGQPTDLNPTMNTVLRTVGNIKKGLIVLGELELQECTRCKKTTCYKTKDKTTNFKSCSRCMRVRYWCVLCPPRSSGAVSGIAVRANIPV